MHVQCACEWESPRPSPVAERGCDARLEHEFHGGQVYNLRADSVISGHSDILGPEVAHAILAAIAAA